MKIYYITGLIILSLLLTGCNRKQNSSHGTDKHVHTEKDAHNHEGHDHDHDDHDGHNHDNHDGHDHGKQEGEGHTDEIVFTKEQAEAIGLKLEVVQYSSFREVIKTSGQIQNAQANEVIIAATADGIVTFANSSLIPGAAIGQGEALVTVSARNLPEGEQTTRVAIEYENAKREYERAETLVEDRIISTREFEQIRLRYETARTAYEAQANNITANGIRVNSPITGYIKNILVAQGAYVSVGEPIATVSRSKHLQLRAEVSERYYKNLTSITGANFRPGYESTLYKLDEMEGRLLSYGKVADEQSFYIPVTFEFNNVGDVIPGSFVEVWLLGRPQSEVITIPISALTEEQGLYFVYLKIGDEEYKKQEVGIGTDNGERVKILSGLNVGDEVVTSGVIQVKLAANAGIIPEGHSH